MTCLVIKINNRSEYEKFCLITKFLKYEKPASYFSGYYYFLYSPSEGYSEQREYQKRQITRGSENRGYSGRTNEPTKEITLEELEYFIPN